MQSSLDVGHISPPRAIQEMILCDRKIRFTVPLGVDWLSRDHTAMNTSALFFSLVAWGAALNSLPPRRSGPWFNRKMTSYQHRKSHCGDKTVVRSSYLHNGISYTGKMSSLYWISPMVAILSATFKIDFMNEDVLFGLNIPKIKMQSTSSQRGFIRWIGIKQVPSQNLNQ